MNASKALETVGLAVHVAGGHPTEYEALRVLERVATEARATVVKLRRVDPGSVKRLADVLEGQP